ncbi:MAG TPA: hypothetical protein VHF89_02375, partial [Solirubrobacteraceae bacterium]|nr:hypothetical protein [Solirubrobacteraceae bacterium]
GAALLVLAAAAPAAAQELAPPAKASETVSFVRTLPGPGVISARFRGGLMYVSSESGLSIYDVGTADDPREIGRLPLPNFENEDIDVGRNVALISNDPSEGAGLLHVIDISNPRAPRRMTSFPIGTADNGILTKPLLGDDSGLGWGTGHTASCVDECRFVYLAGTLSGIDIVDLRDPARPKYVKNFPAEEATAGLASHDVQFDADGNALVSGAGGVAAYDVSDPENPRLVYRTDDTARSRYGIEPNDGSTLNDFVHHNSMRLANSNIAAATGDPAADSNVLAITEEDYTRPACEGAGSFQTWEIAGGRGAGEGVRLARNLDRWDVEVDPTRQSLCSAHYFDVRGGLIAQGWYEQGTRFLDVSDPADIRQVGFWIPNKNVTWGALYPPTDPAGEVVYALDNARGIDVLRFDRPEPGEAPLPTVVAPPGNAPGQGGGAPGGSAASVARTNVALRVTDGRSSVRRTAHYRYRVTVRHLAGPAARRLRVVIAVPRGLLRRRGTRLVRRLPSLAPRASRTWRFTARVPRRSRRRIVLVQAQLYAADDANPRDDRAVDRTRVTRRRARRLSRAEREHLMAQDLALLPTVRAPRSRGRARQIPARRSAYGWVCRVR